MVASVLSSAFSGASLPGKIARRRGHPQADAVNAAGWIGLVTGVLWPLAFVWAFFQPRGAGAEGGGSSGPGVDDERIASFESRLTRLESRAGEDDAETAGNAS